MDLNDTLVLSHLPINVRSELDIPETLKVSLCCRRSFWRTLGGYFYFFRGQSGLCIVAAEPTLKVNRL